MFTDADVDAYWKTLLRNTRAAAAKAKADNDIVELYTVIGVSLHVVQDFYAHSDWVEASGFLRSGLRHHDLLPVASRLLTGGAHGDVIHTGWYDKLPAHPRGQATRRMAAIADRA